MTFHPVSLGKHGFAIHLGVSNVQAQSILSERRLCKDREEDLSQNPRE